MVESQPSKLLVAGSIPVSRSILRQTRASRAATDGRPLSHGWQTTQSTVSAVAARDASIRQGADLSALAARKAIVVFRVADLSAVAASEASV